MLKIRTQLTAGFSDALQKTKPDKPSNTEKG